MFRIRLFFFWLCFLSVACSNQTNSATAEPTPTPLPRGPAAISHNANVVVKKWVYLNPDQALQAFPSRPKEAIAFDPDRHEAYIIWREGGFDIVWSNFICSNQPALRIKEVTIELWLNDGIWDDCESAGAVHAFKVELETNVPREEWTYILHKDAPP